MVNTSTLTVCHVVHNKYCILKTCDHVDGKNIWPTRTIPHGPCGPYHGHQIPTNSSIEHECIDKPHAVWYNVVARREQRETKRTTRTKRETKTMNTKTNNTMGETNDNRNDRDNGNFDGRVVGDFGTTRFRRIRNVIIETTKRGFTMNAMARTYIAFRNVMNGQSGQSAIETMCVLVLMVIVVVIVGTALMGFVDNSDAASQLLGGALGID